MVQLEGELDFRCKCDDELQISKFRSPALIWEDLQAAKSQRFRFRSPLKMADAGEENTPRQSEHDIPRILGWTRSPRFGE